MRRVYYLLLTAFVVSILSSNVWSWPYTAAFVQVFENHRPPYEPGIVASIDFGPIRELEWGRDCDDYCLPPPPMFAVIVDWASPAEPDCYVMVAIGIAGGVYMGSLTLGSCEIRFLDSAKVDLPGVCTQGVHPGWNRYAIWAGPLRSGKYRLRLICFNYPDFRFGLESCPPDKPQYWQYAGTPYVTDEATINIKENCYDFSKITSVFYLANNGTHRVYGNQVLNVLTPYHCVAVLTSTQDAQTIPRELTARLRIDSISAPYPFKFVRWPQADRGSCDTNFMIRHYYYISRNEIIPKEYFDLSPEEWSNVSKVLECDIFGDHSMLANFNDTSIANHVVARLHLDYMNDSTGCFIPAKGDSGYFRFMFSDSVGLDSTSRVYFNIEDRNGDSVYISPISITNIHFDTTMFGFPGMNTAVVSITWNGRYNVGEHIGHLADPENDPYLAYISVNPRSSSPMYSNADTAYVVPKLESVILTHRPWNPPPEFMDTTRVFSIIKAKVDDWGDTSLLFRYYYRDTSTFVQLLSIWNKRTYMFWDLSNVQYFEYLGNQYLPLLAKWKVNYWGNINYKWLITNDFAYYDSVLKKGIIYLFENDTTPQWGNKWNPLIENNIIYDNQRLYPHMRLLASCEVSNKTENIVIQKKRAADSLDSHKIIFGPYKANEDWDLLDWAVTHIGTPYYYGGKAPYKNIDCSGFVTAAIIQWIGPLMNTRYRLNWISANDYARGYYNYPDRNHRLSTGTMVINEEFAHDGDLIVIKKYRNSPVYGHVVIINNVVYDPAAGKITRCFIIHAKGGETFVDRRVKHDDYFVHYRGWIRRILRINP